MDNMINIGTHCFPRSGSFTVLGPDWAELVGMKVARPAADGCFSSAVVAGCLVNRTRFGISTNPMGISVPVTSRMRMSAAGP